MRPKFFVNYDKLTLFSSELAHDYKRLGFKDFYKKYKNVKYNKVLTRYLRAYTLWLYNKENNIKYEYTDIPKVLIVDRFVYDCYFKHNRKYIFNDSLKEAVPEFLKYGFLVTEVQEAVHASNEKI
jgi:hypothetical protein